jgi:hypothetical protein
MRSLVGPFAYAAGSSNTVTMPASAIVTQIIAHSSAGGSVAIFGGTAIPIPVQTAVGSPWVIAFQHDCCQPHGGGASAQIVFTGTDSYYVEYISPQGS